MGWPIQTGAQPIAELGEVGPLERRAHHRLDVAEAVAGVEAALVTLGVNVGAGGTRRALMHLAKG